MDIPRRRFAYRVSEITTEKIWQEPTAGQFPRPPREWRESGLVQGWYGWDSNQPFENRTWRLPSSAKIRPRRATSIVWDPRIQQFYIAPVDCTERASSEIMYQNPSTKDWSTLYFWELLQKAPYPRRGIYKVLEHGTDQQLPFGCPSFFDEYLPWTAFRGDATSQPRICHLVGDLSIILALHAMCPENIADVSQQIKEVFFTNDQSRLVTTTEHGQYVPRNKNSYPERAFVLQTGLIEDNTIEQTLVQQERVLRDWENGRYGPMVSSSLPTREELIMWRAAQQQAAQQADQIAQQQTTQQRPLNSGYFQRKR